VPSPFFILETFFQNTTSSTLKSISEFFKSLNSLFRSLISVTIFGKLLATEPILSALAILDGTEKDSDLINCASFELNGKRL
jgi:hypothetical protein